MNKDFGIASENTLFAHSVCADDENAIKFPKEGKAIKGPFNPGGLDGIPFTVKTGLAAYASHVPEDGCALIFYAHTKKLIINL